MAPGGRRMVVLQGRTAPQTDAAVSGRQYQIAPLSSPRSAFTDLNRTAIRRHGATSISISWGMAVGPAIGRLAVDGSDDFIASSCLLEERQHGALRKPNGRSYAAQPEMAGITGTSEATEGQASRCHQQSFTLEKPNAPAT